MAVRNHEEEEPDLTTHPTLWDRHYQNVHELVESAKGCHLCGLILEAVKYHLHEYGDQEILSISFYPWRNNIHIQSGLKSEKYFCSSLDIHMDAHEEAEKLYRSYQIEPDPFPPILKRIEKNVRSEAVESLARSWLQGCVDGHRACSSANGSWNPPRRLIDIGNGSQNPRLVESVDISSASQDIKWVALSYCWGKDTRHRMELTKDTMDTLKKGQVVHDMFEPTIQDAMHVTRVLGLQYIWIDALCIVQDPTGTDTEWNKEASRMNEIYGGATVTLVAASAQSVVDGFLRERRYPQHIAMVNIGTGQEAIETDCSPQVWLSLKCHQDNEVASGPWSSRGWTMQEGLLSRRLLHYTSSQMIWKCCEATISESGATDSIAAAATRAERLSPPLSSLGMERFRFLPTFMKFKQFSNFYPRQQDGFRISDSAKFDQWYEIVAEYSPRTFTDDGDRLVALSGLAKVYGDIIGYQEYAVGLWKPDLLRGLLWYDVGARFIPRYPPQDLRATKHHFPSWSWVSAGPAYVNTFVMRATLVNPVARIEKVRIDLVDQSQPYGAVKSASITLTGPVRRLSRLYNEHWRDESKPISRLERHLSEVIEQESLERGVEPKYASPLPRVHFAILNLNMIEDWTVLHFLVLESTGKVTGGIENYQRIGPLQLNIRNGFTTSYETGNDWKWDRGDLEGEPWEMETVTIV